MRHNGPLKLCNTVAPKGFYLRRADGTKKAKKSLTDERDIRIVCSFIVLGRRRALKAQWHLRKGQGFHKDHKPVNTRSSVDQGSSYKDLGSGGKQGNESGEAVKWVTTSHLGTADRPGESWGSWRGQAGGPHGRADNWEGGAQWWGWHRGWGWSPRTSKGRSC